MLAYAIPQDMPARLRDSVALVEAARREHASVHPALASLRALAAESLESMRRILVVSLSDRIQTGDRGIDEMPEAERAGYFADLNAALSVVRRSLEQYESADFDNFVRTLGMHDRGLAAELQRTRREFVKYTGEVERALILFGAGGDDDVDLIEDLVPHVA